MGFIRLASLAVLAVTLSGCRGISTPSENRIESFTGTVEVGSVGPAHFFSVGRNGELFVTVTAIAPDLTSIVGVSVGRETSGSCIAVFGYTNNFAQLNRQAIGAPIDKGSYCVVVFDPGSLSRAQSYSVRVSHP